MIAPHDIEKALLSHISEGVEVEPLPEGDGRIACLTPLDYPSGDGVVVWVSSRNGSLDVTDYGEAYASLVTHPPQDYKALVELAAAICRGFGVEFGQGRVMASSDLDDVGETTWRVASASAQIAQASGYYRPRRRRPKDDEFVRQAERTFREQDLSVERDQEVVGSSGHAHHATIFLPRQEAVMEPIGGAGNWSQVSAVYAKFGDLSRANGYRLYTLVDDRERSLEDDIANLLLQVGSLVEWTRREAWIKTLVDNCGRCGFADVAV